MADQQVYEMVTAVTVSLLPEGHIDRSSFEITVEYRDIAARGEVEFRG